MSRRRLCPISGAWAVPACMSCRCRCRSPPSCSACRASCAPIRISFPAMSPITFWAVAAFPPRLTDEVRVKRGLTYGITTSLTSYRKASVMVGSVATRADAVRQTIQVVHDTLADFSANGATQNELDDAQDLPHRLLPAGFRLQCRDRLPAGRFPAPGPGYWLCRQAKRPDPGRDPGRCKTGGETLVRSRAFDRGGGGHAGGRQIRAAKPQAAGPAHAAARRSAAGFRHGPGRDAGPARTTGNARSGRSRQTGGQARGEAGNPAAALNASVDRVRARAVS